MSSQRTYRHGLLFATLIVVCSPAYAADDFRLANAAEKQDKETVRSLLREGADANASQANGTTALHWAAHWDDLETVTLLIRARANANKKNDYGATPLLLACDNGNAEIVEKLLQAGADANAAGSSGETPLMRCARTGNPETIDLLIGHKAEVNAKNKEQEQTALMWAAAQKHPAATQALIGHGADIHARSKGGFTALLFAARVGDQESAKALIRAGAALDVVDPRGMTPLVMASASGHEDTAIVLLENGANPNARDENGATALHYAVMKGMTALNSVSFANYTSHLFRPSLRKLIAVLLQRGADPNIRLEKPPSLGRPAGDTAVGATAFLLAAAAPDPEVMRMLAGAGADVKMPTKNGLTPLMVAAGVERTQDFTDEEKRVAFDAVRLAIELGNDVKTANEDGLTALHGAASNGADDIVKYLVERGADINIRDKYQQTPLSVASGMRLPWIPYGEELGEIIRPSTAKLLLALGATSLDTPGYFKPVTEDSEAYRINRSQRYGGAAAATVSP